MRQLIATKGPLNEPTADALAASLQAGTQAFWLDIEDPDESDYTLLERTFGFHHLTLEDIRHQNQRPKLEEYEGYVFAVMFAADWDGADLRIREHHLYITRLYLVSVHLEPSAELAQLRERLRATPELTKRTPGFLFYLVVDKLVDSLFVVLDRIDDETDVLQDQILERPTNDILSKISSLKRAVVNLRKVLGAQRDLFQRLTSSNLGEPETAIYFRDVHDHIVRQYETVDSLRDILTGAMDIYLTTVSQRLNDVMRRLTVIATLFMPLSFITGFFGMNFGWMTGRITSLWVFAVFGVGSLVVSCAALYVWFRRTGMFGT